MIHRINIFLLSLTLVLSQTFVIASANTAGGSIGGWQIVSNVANGIGAKITATKEVMVNGASKVVTGTANITPKIGDVGRFMGKVGAAAIVTEALKQLLDGVDFVMDPANNTVTYHNKDSQTKPTDIMPWHPSIFYDPSHGGSYNSESAVVDVVIKYMSRYGYHSHSCSFLRSEPYGGRQSSIYTCDAKDPNNKDYTYGTRVVRYANPNYDPAATDESKPITVPLSDVSSQVITQAEQDIKVGNSASPAVVLSRAVAQDMAAEAETDDVKARPIANQFEQSKAYSSEDDATGTIDTPEVIDPVTGEVVKPGESASISMKFPEACKWMPNVCVMADQVVLTIADAKEWVKTENPPVTDTTVQPIEPEPVEKKPDALQWSAYCPFQKESNDITINGETSSFDSDLSEWCETAKDIKPFVLLAGGLASLMIVSGVSIRGDD